MSDLQVIETSYNLSPGEPFCAPEVMTIVEANIKILQGLVGVPGWASVLDEAIRERLRQTKGLVNMICPGDSADDGTCIARDCVSSSYVLFRLIHDTPP